MAILELAGAYILDLVLGDPRNAPHPVRWIGGLIGRMERGIRKVVSGERMEKIAGVVLLAVIVGGTYYVAWLTLKAAAVSWIIEAVVVVYLAYTALATRSLADEAMAIYRLLAAENLPEARQRLSWIVGRDTGSLDEAEIVRATVETVAENASDGVGAPLFYLALGGVPLALAYKAVNTLDSMVGYKNERYRNLGWASARFDDLANYVPARLTALALVASAFVLRKDTAGAWRIFRRDRKNHPSPNSGCPEAAMAGALGVRIGGLSHYGGGASHKPLIGDAEKPLTRETIREGVAMLYSASFFMFLLAAALMFLLGKGLF
ncbi:MAG: adenosylcobinamide-phosphate synthase CbiB [Nitrospirota bacterium]|nr:adenosylcobinamide-phosphate synthase CbiB [Nitrospirota bacterium]